MIEAIERSFGYTREVDIAEAKSHGCSLTSADLQLVMHGGFGAHRFGGDRLLDPMNDVVVDAILHAPAGALHSKQALEIGFIFGEHQPWRAVILKPAFAPAHVVQFN